MPTPSGGFGGRTLRGYDALTVVPRFRFPRPRLLRPRPASAPACATSVPALLVACPTDPMVAAASIGPAAAAAGDAVDLRWIRRGGHMAFASDLDLGIPSARGLPAQLAGCLLSGRQPPLAAFRGSPAPLGNPAEPSRRATAAR